MPCPVSRRIALFFSAIHLVENIWVKETKFYQQQTFYNLLICLLLCLWYLLTTASHTGCSVSWTLYSQNPVLQDCAYVSCILVKCCPKIPYDGSRNLSFSLAYIRAKALPHGAYWQRCYVTSLHQTAKPFLNFLKETSKRNTWHDISSVGFMFTH